ncbi:MAG: hypothetical protein FJ100_02025 [Deltaproteobacteria bacterium]|nr:hypothetical protein [Deltaproteobacteria bacterium]
MLFADRRKYYNRCIPNEVLAPDDPRNVDIDAIEVAGEKPRGVVWSQRLADHFLLADQPVCRFVTGLPGCGKSTDLRRLAQHLREDRTAKLLPVVVEADDYFDLDAPIDVPDLLCGIVIATEAAVAKECGGNPGTPGVAQRLWTWLTQTDVELTKLSAKAGVAEAVLELKQRPDLRERFRNNAASQVRALVDHVRKDMGALQAQAQAAGWAGLLVIVDSLEKLRGISTTWLQVLDSAERVFVQQADDLALGVHAVYTVPMALMWRMRRPIDVVPMIKLHDRLDLADPPRLLPAGREAARTIVRQRIDEAGLQALFGDDWSAAVDDLIRLSGGYPRELVRLLQNAVHAVGDVPLDAQARERLAAEFRDQLQRMVARDDLPMLREVARERQVRVDRAQLSALDHLVRAQVILAYHNAQPWFDVHPAVRGLLHEPAPAVGP